MTKQFKASDPLLTIMDMVMYSPNVRPALSLYIYVDTQGNHHGWAMLVDNLPAAAVVEVELGHGREMVVGYMIYYSSQIVFHFDLSLRKMPEGITAESLMHNIMETITDSASKPKSESFFEEENLKSMNSQFNRLFGRQRHVHHILGCAADVLLWRNKKISASVLTAATVTWVLFEWLNYNFLTILCFVLVMGMLAQLVWKNASGILNRTPSNIPRLVVPVEVFVNIANLIGAEVNRGLSFLQDVATEGNMKQFLVVVASLWAAAIIGCWFNLLTILYVGFIAAHTLKMRLMVFVYNVLGQLQRNYCQLDASVLRRILTSKFRGRKVD
ncbi:reticulon-like protein B8 [Olea europaea var. sylvestris]|uniref:reticulon-like protein B8 n=1 Tax=Olea europaea var. sylvestris TaxID=158386 RepID=UPI000C1CE421|nr:reticulon-like protein B8 [Olea europaea var. sylvestris]